MIQSLELTNFKCFQQQLVVVKPLTLLAGLNSSGKSTILQALLLLRQSYLENLLPSVGLTLNGKLAELGTAKDVLFEEADIDEIGFELKDDLPAHLKLRFAYREESDVLAVNGYEHSGEIWKTSLFRDEFQYLRAERIGPRTSFGMSDYEVRHHRQLGSSGEFAAHFLSLFGSETVESEGLRHPAATSNTLQSQVEAWMTEISPGVRLNVKRYSEMDLMTFNVTYILGHQVASSEYRPTNVGFGITYALADCYFRALSSARQSRPYRESRSSSSSAWTSKDGRASVSGICNWYPDYPRNSQRPRTERNSTSRSWTKSRSV